MTDPSSQSTPPSRTAPSLDIDKSDARTDQSRLHSRRDEDGRSRREHLAHTTISGDLAIDLLEATTRVDCVDLECSIDCASGRSETARWRGLPIGDLLSRTDLDADATHLLVEGADGFRVCVPLTTVVDGILALERLDDSSDRLPRFVAPSLDGTRMVTRVTRIDAKRLSPGTDPSRLERFGSNSELDSDPNSDRDPDPDA